MAKEPPNARPAKRTKFDALTAVFDRLADVLRQSDDPEAKSLLRSLEISRAEREADHRRDRPIGSPSAYAMGMEQGLNDLFSIFVHTGSRHPSRRRLLDALRAIVSEEYPEFAEKQRRDLARVLEKGRIGTESQYDRVRNRIDEIEGDPKHEAELRQLYRLIESYDSR